MQKMIPNVIEMERKLDVLPNGSFTDEGLDNIFAHIDTLAGPPDAEEVSTKKSNSIKKAM